MVAIQIDKYQDEVKTLIEERLRIKGATLEASVTRAGRLLPKWARADAQRLVTAGQLLKHPKLQQTVDTAAVEKSRKALVAHLKTIDPKERRKTQILKLLGAVSFNLIVVGAAFVAFLVWRGYV